MVCPIIKDPEYIKEEVKIVEVDDRLLLGYSAITILVNEQIEILYAAETPAWNSPNSKKSTAHIVYVSLFALIEVCISFFKDVHS